VKWYNFAFFVFTAWAAAAPSAAAADADEEMLRGTWELESLEVQGKNLPTPAGTGGSIVFAKDRTLIWKDPGKPEKIGNYTIDAGKTPKQIDLIVSSKADSKPIQGIYTLEGDKLTIAFSTEGPKGKRPSNFKGEKVMIVHWKRRKS